MEESNFKRYAAHEVIVSGNESISMAVVELTDGYVTDYYTFAEELPFTEWLGGTIEIIDDNEGHKIALWNNKRL